MKKSLTLIISLVLILLLSPISAQPELQNRIVGIHGAVLDNVQQRLKIKQQTTTGKLTPVQIKRFYQQASREIKQAMAPYGYFKPTIRSRLTRTAKGWQADYTITPGPVLKITHLELQITGEGKNDPKFKQLVANFPVKQGQPFSTKKYEDAKQRLFDLAARRGYLAAKMQRSTILINLRRYTATVILHFNTGPRYYFGDAFFQPSPFSVKFLRRYLTFKKGEPYSETKIRKLQQELSSSDYFSQVIVKPQPKQAKYLHVPVYIDLVPQKSKQYSFGVGYGTDTGVRGLIGIKLRRVTSTGQQFQATVHASQITTSLEAKYIIPGHHPATEQYNISAAIQEQHLTTGDSHSRKAALSYINNFKGWQQTLALTFLNERYNNVGKPTRTANMLVPSVNWLRVKSDHPIRPTQGYRISAFIRGASTATIANISFFQAQVHAKMIQTITRSNRLVLRGTLGYTAINDLDALPLTYQFFTGGAQSVRGYDYSSIGPGRDLVVGSVELQHRVYGNWYVSAFFDAGSAGRATSIRDPKKGAGVGILWLSPVGALQLSVAKAIDLPGQPTKVQFSMGPEL